MQSIADEIDELLELAQESLHNEDREEALRYFGTATGAAEQLDEIFKDIDCYEEQKDFWRSGLQAVREGRLQEAVEDMRNFIEAFK